MNDPYQVLGVRSDATDEEIKQAYRGLVKKYHPDRYANSPMYDKAQEKLKEINIAHDSIEKMRAGNQGGAGGADVHWDFRQEAGSSYFSDVREMIARGLIAQAEASLDRMNDRPAEWYYLRGVVYLRRGWFAQARQSFSQAVTMEPDNEEYQAAVRRMSDAFQGANQRSAGSHGFRSSSCCNICGVVICASTCCGSGGTALPFLFCC